MNHFEAGGSFSLTLEKQEKLLLSKRSAVDHLELPEAMESSLLAFINHSTLNIIIITELTTYIALFPCDATFKNNVHVISSH